VRRKRELLVIWALIVPGKDFVHEREQTKMPEMMARFQADEQKLESVGVEGRIHEEKILGEGEHLSLNYLSSPY
jgi:hypothetical protein